MDRGFFLIYIYIYSGGWVGGFLTLYSVAVKQDTLRWAWAAKRLFCLLWQTSAYTGSPLPPPPPRSHLGCKLNSFLVFKLRKWKEKASTVKPPRGRLRTALSCFSCGGQSFLKVPNPQWKVSLSHIWQRRFLKCPRSRCWLFHTSEFNTGISFLLPNTLAHLEGGLPHPSRPRVILSMVGDDWCSCDLGLQVDGSALGSLFSDIRKVG